MLTNLLQSGLDSTVEAAVQPQEMTMSLFDLFLKGGALMWVLLALSIIAIYNLGQKWWMIRKAGIIDKNFLKDIHAFLHENKIKSATELCQKYDTPITRVIEKGIGRKDRPVQDIQMAMENTANVEISVLEKGLPMLATIAGGAPMIGFLGTVMGMIQAFFNMANAGNNIDITLLSGGIYTAMVTTVGGLIVGILAYFGYNFLTSRISDLTSTIESTTMEFMDIINEDIAGNRQ